MRKQMDRKAVLAIAIALSALVASQAGAASRNMVGSITIENPSAGFELTPGIYGKPLGGAGPDLYPPTDGPRNVSVAGTAATTSVGRQISIAANEMNRTGFDYNVYPAFANVGQVSKSHMTIQQAATFATGAGALAACPGPGCTGSGTGTAISFCPPVSHDPLDPAPGTAGAPIGNWDCASWQAGVGGGDRFLRIGITNSSGRPNFGGTFTLLRNHAMNVWRVPVQPSTPNASDAEASRSFMDISNTWTPGVTNFEFTGLSGSPGPIVNARIDGVGGIQSTFGCANGIGTVGGSYMRSSPIVNAGSNCGTATGMLAPGQGWGFKMTTGNISGSDPYPYGAVNTTVMGTPFNPIIAPQAASQGFFFSRQGTDEITSGGNRNIVLLGGGLAVDPNSGNSYFRVSALRMNLSVPEPAAGLGLLVGTGFLAALVRRRTRS
jgi:hypothetical protein